MLPLHLIQVFIDLTSLRKWRARTSVASAGDDVEVLNMRPCACDMSLLKETTIRHEENVCCLLPIEPRSNGSSSPQVSQYNQWRHHRCERGEPAPVNGPTNELCYRHAAIQIRNSKLFIHPKPLLCFRNPTKASFSSAPFILRPHLWLD